MTVEKVNDTGLADAISSDLRCHVLNLQVVTGAEAAPLSDRRVHVLLW